MTPVDALERRVEDPPMSLVDHLSELRRRLLWSLAILAAGTWFSFGWSAPLLSFLARPVGGLVFTAPTDAFYTRLKAAVFLGLGLTLPLLLHQAWLFVARALEPRWKALLKRLLPLSYLLFLAGAALAVLVVVPAAMRFLLAYGSDDVRPMLTLSAYLEFVTHLSLAFGLVFQLPLVLFFLNRIGLVSRLQATGARRYAYVLSFVFAALLTPGPDVISQAALALPTLVLFELTLLVLQ